MSRTIDPYIYGRPVKDPDFINRDYELDVIFSRLQKGESTAIVGEPHIGKSSLLFQILNKKTQRKFINSQISRYKFAFINAQTLDQSYSLKNFWEEVLASVERTKDQEILELIEMVKNNNFGRRYLIELFEHLTIRKIQVVLLIDEFECLLELPDLKNQAFFGLLRSLATQSGSLCIISASRPTIKQMYDRSNQLIYSVGSPFFNNMIEIHLHPFDQPAIDALILRSNGLITQQEKLFIQKVAGRHPFLLQAMASNVIKAKANNFEISMAAEKFYQQVSNHFDDLWANLDEKTKTTSVILCLVEFGGRVLGKDFAFGEIERIENFGPELSRLLDKGLAVKVSNKWEFDWDNLLLWRGERWTIGSQAYAWWVRDVVISHTRKLPSYDEWLANKSYNLLLTQEQWNNLNKALKKAPTWAITGVKGLAMEIFKGIMSKNHES